MGWRQFIRERLASADVQSYLMDQAVMQFASASARDTELPQASRKVGMLAHTASDGVFWTPATNGGVWVPVVRTGSVETVCTVSGGWAAVSGHQPRARKLSINRVRLLGWFSNAGAYVANATQTPITVPAGFAPVQTQFFDIPAGGVDRARVTVLTSGVIRIDSTFGATLGAGTAHSLDGLEYDTTYTGV